MTTNTDPHFDRLNHLVEAITFQTILTQTTLTLTTQTTTITVITTTTITVITTTTITEITTIIIRTIMDPIWLDGPVTMEIITEGVSL